MVLEALPPEIRAEVLEEEARSREAPAPASEIDNASFIASLDPMLREEVLLSAPEEVLRSLPAELVAEAQLLRDRVGKPEALCCSWCLLVLIRFQ